MSKYARVVGDKVWEIIPEENTAPNIQYYYGKEFADQCMLVSNEVEQHWIRDKNTGKFNPPVELGDFEE